MKAEVRIAKIYIKLFISGINSQVFAHTKAIGSAKQPWIMPTRFCRPQ